MKRFVTRVIATCAIVGLAACGGGSTSSAVPASGVSQPLSNATARFKVVIPGAATASGKRRPMYLTPSVKGIDFTVTQTSNRNANGYVFYALTPQSTYCTGGGASPLVCTLDVQAPPGADTFVVNTYDNANPSAVANGGYSHVISTASLVQTIAANAVNTINITTNGVPTLIAVALDKPFPAAGAPTTANVNLFAADADGYIIVGPFDMALTLTDSDASGITKLSKTSFASSSDFSNVTLSYTGAALTTAAAITLHAQSPAGGLNYGPFTATASFQPGANAPYATPGVLLFAHANSSAQSISAAGAGTSSAPFTLSTAYPANGSNTCNGIVTVSGTSPPFSVTPVAAGACYLVLTDAAHVETDIPVLVSP